ncbi:unnamed protein product [Absidia cylindrospora]
MSSPPNSLHDIEDAASKKRGRAQSVEPTPIPKDEAEIDKTPSVSAPKKTKRDDECPNTNKSSSVSTIRRNMKDMSTTDKTVDTLDESMAGDSQEPSNDDENIYHAMDTHIEEGSDTQSLEHGSQHTLSPKGHGDNDNTDQSPNTNTNSNIDSTTATDSLDKGLGSNSNATGKSFSQFGSKNNGDTNDWSEFADDNDDEQQNKVPTPKSEDDKPKYTFGSSSGFGTKGWASIHQSTPNTTQKPSSFSGTSGSTFGSSTSGLSGFSLSSPSSTSPATKPKPAFGAFANAPTSSPFALAAASGTTNALSSLPKANASTALSPGGESTTSSVTSSDYPDGQSSHADDDLQDNGRHNGTETSAFGEGSKIKVPGVKQTEVKTGEEDEDTVYQTKAKLLVLDTTTNNWKERGAGTFRINVKEVETTEQTTTQSRLVMRADSVYRLILNLLLFTEMKVFIMQDRFVRFAGFESETKEDGTNNPKLVNYALKVR